jgi:hypothetical protein
MNAILPPSVSSLDAIHDAINFPHFPPYLLPRAASGSLAVHPSLLAWLHRRVSLLSLNPVSQIGRNLHQVRWAFLSFGQTIYVHRGCLAG